jgi:hypothetical protein
MATYTVTVNDAQDKALRYVMLDPQEWAQNAIDVRATEAIEKIAKDEIDRKLAAGETVSGTKEDLVLAANIKSVAERNLETPGA